MGSKALLHVFQRHPWAPALALFLAMALGGCNSGGSRASRLPLSTTYAGIASVQAELLEPADPADEAVYAGMTRVTLRVESLTRLVYVRSGQVRIDLPDGRQFRPLSPAVVRESVSRQREEWRRSRPPEYGQAFQGGQPGAGPVPTAPAAPPERSEPLVSRKLVDNVCSSLKYARFVSLASLVLLAPCGAVAALHFATLPKGYVEPDPDDSQRSLRRRYLGNNLAALKEVELGTDDTVTGTLIFPVPSEEIRATPGAVMTIPMLEWRSGTEAVARIALTPLEPATTPLPPGTAGKALPAAAGAASPTE